MVTTSTFFKAISHIKDTEFTDAEFERDYIPYFVNKSLSYYADTALAANEINTRPNIDNKNQYRFLVYSVPKRRRKPIWVKPVKDKILNIIADYYGVSLEKAEPYMNILSEKQINIIIDEMNLGGMEK